MIIERNINHAFELVGLAAGGLVALISFLLLCTSCLGKKSDKKKETDKEKEQKPLLNSTNKDYNESLQTLTEDSTPFMRCVKDEQLINSIKDEPFIVRVEDEQPKINSKEEKVPVSPSEPESIHFEEKSSHLMLDIESPSSLHSSMEELNDTIDVNALENSKGISASTDSLSTLLDTPETNNGAELGIIYFTVHYNESESNLVVVIDKAQQLLPKDANGSISAFVRVMLLPDRKNRFETKVVKKSLDPLWNEPFTFKIPEGQDKNDKVLYFEVSDYDGFLKHTKLGTARLSLADVDLTENPLSFEKNLATPRQSENEIGDLLISLRYDTVSKSVVIGILKSEILKKMDSNPYVKMYLISSGKKIDKKKTTVKKHTSVPVWNETFNFEIEAEELDKHYFVFTVGNHDRLLPNDPIGHVVIGYQSHGKALNHWKEMVNHQGEEITVWHRLTKYNVSPEVIHEKIHKYQSNK